MKKYIGTKIIMAKPGTLAEAQAIKSGMPENKIKEIVADCTGDPGYIVQYPDNYISWSPKDVFEEAYRECDNMTFGLALEALKKGCRVARKGWNGKGIYLEMQRPDEHSKMTLPYIYIVTNGLVTDNPDAPKGVVPWLASQTDMLSVDWIIVE